ncbi:MAG: hypothetical protein E6H06_18890 [Bacteroidetes bacterium]|nr:MAG: hypothetical protein E6H06_18890 [Bacteroidota bacterium]
MSAAKKKFKKKPGQSQSRTVSESAADVKRNENKIAVERKKGLGSRPLLPGPWQINLGIFALIMIGMVAFYSPDLHLGFFAVDDPDYVVKNPWIQSISGENINHILTTPYFANYSPAHLFSYMVDYAIGGPNAFAFHLSSNIWAGVVAGFVFLMALAFTQNKWVSIAAAILFIVHPVHVEAVAWISSRKDLVAAAFALPSFLAYLRYRNDKARRWYIISLFLFLLAVAGKLSVATFPAFFFAYDIFIEKRSWRRAIVDKIPFLVAALIVALAAASAQPSMGHRPDPYVLSAALVQNIWLLSGFGSYVLYRLPPETTQTIWEIGGAFFLIAVVVVPFFLRKRFPLVAVLIYWILFGFIPAQVLSFTHPVTDRYIFFPSVAAVILLAWGIFEITKRIGRYQLAVLSSLTLIIAIIWAINTMNYISEWKDPRSVWYAAMKKSSDPTISQNLGSYYVGLARSIGDSSQSISKEELQRLASAVWSKDPRLPKLNSELSTSQQSGPMKREFKDQILSLAWDAFEKTLQGKEDRVMPALFYNRGLILLEKNDLNGAKKEFLAGVNEASRETFAPVRNELTVYCYTDLGIISWKQANYQEALKWFRLGEQQQNMAGANWVPTISQTCKQLEAIIASKPAH